MLSIDGYTCFDFIIPIVGSGIDYNHLRVSQFVLRG